MAEDRPGQKGMGLNLSMLRTLSLLSSLAVLHNQPVQLSGWRNTYTSPAEELCMSRGGTLIVDCDSVTMRVRLRQCDNESATATV